MPIAAQHMIIPRSTSYGVVIGLPQQRVITCTPCDQIITCACVNFIICIVSEHIIKSTARKYVFDDGPKCNRSIVINVMRIPKCGRRPRP
jgi:hypothetical protein